ncbi:MraY family glycosyltransferase [Thermodesulfovibrio sp. TK110]
MPFLLIAFISSFLLCLILIKIKHESHLDSSDGVQKFHSWQVSRTGGFAIFLSLIFVCISFFIAGKDFSHKFLSVILSCIPVFIGGFIEDLTKRVSAKIRLAFAFLSGILACFLLDANLLRIDIPYFDDALMKSHIFSILFTAFALTGVSNAINIIDGFNGLASGVSILVFLSYAYVSFLAGDSFLLYLNLCIFASLMGFFLWNYPFGKIFLGDGGAYTMGFLAGLTGVLLVNNHSQVSAWFPFLLLLYPIWETVFSIWRRKFAHSLSPFKPDSVHLHTLIYRRVVRPKFRKITIRLRNSLTSPYLWIMQTLCTIPALLFWRDKILLILSCIAFAVFYIWLYFRIIKFRTPKILKF